MAELLTFKPDTGKTLDKISVLRLTSSYIKFQNFMKSGERREEEGREEAEKKGERRKGRHIDRRKEEGEILEKGGREEGREGERNRAKT